ncbi:cupin domain-containing protein [Leisingera methylohalidivorans]|uniref:Cupin type-2 domain-containing protein n=1 Tax=Leisingera methylohalidivorans DSM 14336 TaxID=999552 RepID=V9W2B9_9RHOB|nr:cupin domain-containing protein [Leisingera methylohalidivorans]AHD03332.1 hypothetical protein METH_21145 [Leisingera methylohalidivorans DSM 14336]
MSIDNVRSTSFASVARRAASWRRPWRRLSGAVFCCLVVIATLLITVAAGNAHDAKPGIAGVQRELLRQMPLPDSPGRFVTALTIELAPGAVVGPHRHGGFVYVYLLEGRIRSQLEGQNPVEYSSGQSWTEPAEVLHRRTENPSTTEPAKFLAVIYSDADAVITRPETDN